MNPDTTNGSVGNDDNNHNVCNIDPIKSSDIHSKNNGNNDGNVSNICLSIVGIPGSSAIDTTRSYDYPVSTTGISINSINGIVCCINSKNNNKLYIETQKTNPDTTNNCDENIKDAKNCDTNIECIDVSGSVGNDDNNCSVCNFDPINFNDSHSENDGNSDGNVNNLCMSIVGIPGSSAIDTTG
jgi:hypothetical protein